MRLLNPLVVVLVLSGCAGPSGAVTPVVEDAGIADGRVTVAGRVGGVAEDGGTCRFTFWAENGAASRLTADGVAAGDHTECGPVSEQLFILAPGEFEVSLRYVTVAGDVVESDRDDVTLVVP